MLLEYLRLLTTTPQRRTAGLNQEKKVKVCVAFIAWCTLLIFSRAVALHALVFVLLFWLPSLRRRLTGMTAGEVFMRLNALLLIPARALSRWG